MGVVNLIALVIVHLSVVAVAFDDPTHNPYRSLILPMCFQYEPLMHATLAIAAMHRRKTGLTDKSEAFRHRVLSEKESSERP